MKDIKIYVRVVISMMVLCDANTVIEYGRRISEPPSALLDMEYDNNSTEQKSSKHINNMLSRTPKVFADNHVLHGLSWSGHVHGVR